MSYTVYIRDNSSGEIRASVMDSDWSPSSYCWWTGGNMECDCNREELFRRAGGLPDMEWCERGSSRFSVWGVRLSEGWWLVPVPNRE